MVPALHVLKLEQKQAANKSRNGEEEALVNMNGSW